MDTVQTDYLIIGACASGMVFADTLLSETGYEMIIVDRRAYPGGHWWMLIHLSNCISHKLTMV